MHPCATLLSKLVEADLINPEIPGYRLVIDHSVQVDFFGTDQALEQNIALNLNEIMSAMSFSGQKIHI